MLTQDSHYKSTNQSQVNHGMYSQTDSKARVGQVNRDNMNDNTNMDEDIENQEENKEFKPLQNGCH